MSGSVFAAHLLTRLQDLNLRGDFYFDQELFALCEPLQSADQRILFLHKYYDMAQEDSIETAEDAFLKDYFGKHLPPAETDDFDPTQLLNDSYQASHAAVTADIEADHNSEPMIAEQSSQDEHENSATDASFDAALAKMLEDVDDSVIEGETVARETAAPVADNQFEMEEHALTEQHFADQPEEDEVTVVEQPQDDFVESGEQNDSSASADDADSRFDAVLAKMLAGESVETTTADDEPDRDNEGEHDFIDLEDDTSSEFSADEAKAPTEIDDPDALLDAKLAAMLAGRSDSDSTSNQDEDEFADATTAIETSIDEDVDEDDGFFIADENEKDSADHPISQNEDPDDAFDARLAEMLNLSAASETKSDSLVIDSDDDDDDDDFSDFEWDDDDEDELDHQQEDEIQQHENEEPAITAAPEIDPFAILGEFEKQFSEGDQGHEFITHLEHKLEPLPVDFAWQQQLQPIIIANAQLELLKLQLDDATPLCMRLCGDLAIILVNQQWQYLTSQHVDDDFRFADYLNQAREELFQHVAEFHYEMAAPGVYHVNHIEQHSTALLLFGYKLFKRCQLKGEPVVMLPDQHNLFITGSEDAEGLQYLIKQAQATIESESADLISPELFHFVNNRLQFFSLTDELMQRQMTELRAAYHYAWMRAQAEFIHQLCDAEIKVDRVQLRINDNNPNQPSCYTTTAVHAFTFKLKDKILLPRVDYLTLAHFIDNETQAITLPWRDVALVCSKLFNPIPELNEWYELTTMPNEKQWQRLLAKDLSQK
jgi:hypothetical protein